MVISSRKMLRLPVRTKSGTRLGRVASFDLDTDTGKLVAVHVLPGVAARLLTDELVISWAQIVEITEQMVLVADAVIPISAMQVARIQETA